jgi:L-galactose dehydrogenase
MERSEAIGTGANHGGLRFRRLGRTKLDISIVGFGASPLGGVFGPVEPDEATRAVHFALDSGINFFDVSPYYGLTLAEERLGRALKGRRHKAILATKCGRYGEAEFDFSAKRIRQSLSESLSRLGTDYVDILLAHDVEFGDERQIVEETIPELRRFQEEGKARYIGITGYPLKTLVRIAEAAVVDVILSYCRYNLLIDDMDSVLMPFAEKHGIGVINASPLHMGLLTERVVPAWHPAPDAVRQAGQAAAEFCRMHDQDLPGLAMQFCFDYSRVASTLVGIADARQVLRSVQASQTAPSPGLLAQVTRILAPAHNYVWQSGLTR